MTITTLPLESVEPVERELLPTHVVAGHGAEAAEWNVAGFLANAGHDASAVWVDGHHRHTYAQLRGAAATIAEALRARDVVRGDPVGLYARNGFFWIAAYLGILSAGMVAVPLAAVESPTEANRRARWAGCRVVAVGQGQRWSHDLGSIPTLAEYDLPPGWDVTTAERLDAAPVAAAADAVYAFTPPAAHEPRAVRITHGNIRANAQSVLDCLHLEGADRTLAVLPFSDDFGASLLHTHLHIGAALVHHASPTVPETIVDALERFNCTSLAAGSTVYAALVRNSSFTLRRLPQLRLLQQRGRPPSPAIDDQLTQAHPSAHLFTMYGHTEATACLSYLAPEHRARHLGSVGRGIPGVRLRVVDADGRDVGVGEVGEVWATGGNISAGYLNDDVTTMRRMRDRVLHTGDAATVDDEGYVYLTAQAVTRR